MAQTPLPASSTNRPNSPRSPHLCSGPSASTPSSSLPPAAPAPRSAPALLFAGHCFPVLPPAHVTWLASQWHTHSVGGGSALGCSWSSSLPLVGTGSHRPTPSRLSGLARSEQGLRPRPHQRLWPCEAVGLWGPPQGAAAALASPHGRSHQQCCWFLLCGQAVAPRTRQAVCTHRPALLVSPGWLPHACHPDWGQAAGRADPPLGRNPCGSFQVCWEAGSGRAHRRPVPQRKHLLRTG